MVRLLNWDFGFELFKNLTGFLELSTWTEVCSLRLVRDFGPQGGSRTSSRRNVSRILQMARAGQSKTLGT